MGTHTPSSHLALGGRFRRWSLVPDLRFKEIGYRYLYMDIKYNILLKLFLCEKHLNVLDSENNMYSMSEKETKEDKIQKMKKEVKITVSLK